MSQSRSAESAAAPRRLRFAYIGALTLLGLVVIAAHLSTAAAFERNRMAAHLINTAGWQRTLSQKVAAAAGATVTAPADERLEHADRLQRLADELELNQHALRFGDAKRQLPPPPDDLQARYAELQPVLDELVMSAATVIGYADGVTPQASAAEAARHAVGLAGELTAGMDEIVDAKAERSLAAFSEVHDRELAMSAGVLLAALLIAMTIFEPTCRLLSRKLRELEAARETAEDASRAKTAFLACMSHELRTPMTAIVGYGDLLTQPGITPSEIVDHAQVVRRNARHLLAMLNDTLDMAKIEAGELGVECIACDPVLIVEEAIGMLRARAADRGVLLGATYEAPVPRRIASDPLRVQQILLNLIGNAIKFTERGGRVVVTLTYREAGAVEGAGAGCAVFAVRDSGIGMTHDQVARVFEPFRRADETTTRRFGGTGLGLSISRELAQRLGGDIHVESAMGRGSVFTAEIDAGPRDGVKLVDEVDPLMLHRERQKRETVHDAIRVSGRVLVVDDGIDNRRLIGHHLRRAGAEVAVAPDGRKGASAALDAQAAGTPFDLVLMDMQMPVLDGYAATSLLRRKGYTRPIVALTANALAGDRERCLEAGCDEYLSKPIDVAALLRICAWAVAGELGPTVHN
jgi:signal transduction histidine kinase/ActR/RegA family two-component response regulator